MKNGSAKSETLGLEETTPQSRARQSKMRVLVAGLDPAQEQLASRSLRSAGLEVCIAKNVFDSLLGDDEPEFTCLVLGVEISDVEYLRKVGIRTPILTLLTDSSVEGRVVALDTGSDDCLGPRFAVSEFVARVHALCRRPVQIADPVKVAVGGLSLCLETCTATLNDVTAALTPIEAEILRYLMENYGRVLSSSQIGRSVWGEALEIDRNLVSVHVSNLRRKLRSVLRTSTIRTLRGRGYLMQ